MVAAKMPDTTRPQANEGSVRTSQHDEHRFGARGRKERRRNGGAAHKADADGRSPNETTTQTTAMMRLFLISLEWRTLMKRTSTWGLPK